MKRTEQPEPQHSPTPDARQLPDGVRLSEHRPPAPTPAEHNRAFAERPDYSQHSPSGFDSAGQSTGGR